MKIELLKVIFYDIKLFQRTYNIISIRVNKIAADVWNFFVDTR